MVKKAFSVLGKGVLAVIFLTVAAGGSDIGSHAFADSPATVLSKKVSPAACSPSGGTPERIILNLTTTPASSQAATWRTTCPVAQPRAEIAPATGFADFSEKSRSVTAQTQTVPLEDGTVVYHHAAIFTSLAPKTRYAYRVGGDGLWSEWSQFETADQRPAPFTFVYLGDPQEEVKSKCSRLFRAAYRKAPEADFWHFVGDLVDNGDRDEEWAELFYALGWIPRTTPMVLLPGNHEYPDKRFVKGADYRLFHLWRPHFTLPANGPAGLEETVYTLDYQGTRLVMLNGNERLADQARWLERVLSQTPQNWTIAAIHQPVYSTGKRRNRKNLQQLFVPIFDRYEVDLVLQGHDHTYSRTVKLKNGARAAPDESGTVYVISVSGPKSYPVNPRYQALMAKTGTGRQLFQVIQVSPRRLQYEAFDAAGTLYDSFLLEKN